ncbi:MAG: hypothetical protein ABMA25_27205 [Ilumatobacteraceae bacterium]
MIRRFMVSEIGRTYAQFMLGNDRAARTQEAEMSCTIDGIEYRQGTFPYQVKCLAWLRAEHAALSTADRAVVDSLLAGTGCEALFE